MHCFDKRRPKVFTNYVIPNEYFMLNRLTKVEGVGITLLKNAEQFIQEEKLKLIWRTSLYPNREYYLISHKKNKSFFEEVKRVIG